VNLRMALEEIVRRPINSPRDAEQAREAADAIGQYLQWEANARRLLQRVQGDPGEAPSPESLQGLTLHEAARRVLQEAGRPLYVKDLGTRIKAGGWRHPRSENARPDLIFFQLAARLPRHGDTFERVAPNTFALVEWSGRPPGSADPRPATGLFDGPGDPIGAAIAESDEAITSRDSAWRSS
jgi:HB1, ASXL, restriction endonuclease HTH domain